MYIYKLTVAVSLSVVVNCLNVNYLITLCMQLNTKKINKKKKKKYLEMVQWTFY